MCEVEEEGEEREVCSFTYTQVFISYHFHREHDPGPPQDGRKSSEMQSSDQQISIIVLTQGKPHCSSGGSGDDARLEVAAFFAKKLSKYFYHFEAHIKGGIFSTLHVQVGEDGGHNLPPQTQCKS